MFEETKDSVAKGETYVQAAKGKKEKRKKVRRVGGPDVRVAKRDVCARSETCVCETKRV